MTTPTFTTPRLSVYAHQWTSATYYIAICEGVNVAAARVTPGDKTDRIELIETTTGKGRTSAARELWRGIEKHTGRKCLSVGVRAPRVGGKAIERSKV